MVKLQGIDDKLVMAKRERKEKKEERLDQMSGWDAVT
jgi:hypothetical protein